MTSPVFTQPVGSGLDLYAKVSWLDQIGFSLAMVQHSNSWYSAASRYQACFISQGVAVCPQTFRNLVRRLTLPLDCQSAWNSAMQSRFAISESRIVNERGASTGK